MTNMNALCYKTMFTHTKRPRKNLCVKKGETIIYVHGSLLRNKYIRIRVAILSEEKRNQWRTGVRQARNESLNLSGTSPVPFAHRKENKYTIPINR